MKKAKKAAKKAKKHASHAGTFDISTHGHASSINCRDTADDGASAAPARFAANDAQLARMSELFATGMATPRGDLVGRCRLTPG